jgi:3-carboxy-cis,cis-muconate cycloisomerase
MFALTGAALTKANFLSKNLVVDEGRMRENVSASNGLMLAEAVSFALADYMSRAEAKKLVSEAVQVVLAENRHLVEVVREQVDAPLDWATLKDEAAYFGASEAFIERVLQTVSAIK